MFTRINKIHQEFPGTFWIVVLVSFIDSLGSHLLFPFFSLYITQKFNVGMTQAGIVLGLWSAFGLIGSMVGGVLTDRFGRRQLILFGLVFSALSSLSLGLANSLAILYPLSIGIGFLSNIDGPAYNAMVADLLPEKQRSEGFGILRVADNLAWIIGPAIGGFVATRSFFMLFVIDSVLSCIIAIIFYKLVSETKPAVHAEKSHETIWQTATGYKVALRDLAFMAFLFVTLLMLLVYYQIQNTLPVYLRNVHGFSTEAYGFMLMSTAVLVVLAQFWVTRMTKNRPPFVMMALGAALYAIGFGMFGFISAYGLFLLAALVITFGEMIVEPISQALAANFAPPDMRGRYMAVFGLASIIPTTIGPGLAGLILDNFNPNLLWYLGGTLCIISALGFYLLHRWLGSQERFTARGRQEHPADPLV
ncbi:MAG: MFS transporter [Anaerolineales bacterium]|jgi:MFS family permease